MLRGISVSFFFLFLFFSRCIPLLPSRLLPLALKRYSFVNAACAVVERTVLPVRVKKL